MFVLLWIWGIEYLQLWSPASGCFARGSLYDWGCSFRRNLCHLSQRLLVSCILHSATPAELWVCMTVMDCWTKHLVGIDLTMSLTFWCMDGLREFHPLLKIIAIDHTYYKTWVVLLIMAIERGFHAFFGQIWIYVEISKNYFYVYQKLIQGSLLDYHVLIVYILGHAYLDVCDTFWSKCACSILGSVEKHLKFT